jgi:hypothetical protein
VKAVWERKTAAFEIRFFFALPLICIFGIYFCFFSSDVDKATNLWYTDVDKSTSTQADQRNG